ncbi:S1/P1 nuclease [Ralstonia pseudosolanacearum]|uniref:S1/P1 nuclease n=1 Tax=Ralstonia pseudosolanacearum TaxID=1310165 RepID=UPI0007D7E25F|nr:S1/P1 nuclease [Ralstonia pseudosolanacearum]MDC6293928.1 S1/P1 nuclease [Ralstonia pseudosolanacearum]MDD7790858.1 S1/P1 nuclease [Ralstonia pseudosolanacearum]MDN3367255.1 S1/P1 nuclease [Ralstonia pseudosolanacearum]OAK89306.1 hypothetical protein AB851_20775 [Ralstonia pseudosolanacearum]QOK88815.1 S1/P1 nuclease [Ralstonia pseudosolanacearum]
MSPANPLLRAALAWAIMTACVSAFAFGPDGHQTVGELADSLIAGTNAESQVQNILGMTLEQASVWADCAKGVTRTQSGKFVYQGAGHYPECKPFETTTGKSAMVAFVKRNWSGCHPAADEEVCHKQYHYTDVALQRGQYQQGLVGTSDHDIVAAIRAAIIKLQGGTTPSPIDFASKREALLLLSHYVGDIHQPLHVSAVYLDAQGHVVDPDQGTFDPQTKTIGGNSILDAGKKLHFEWDQVPAALKPDQLGVSGVAEARAIPLTSGDIISWPAQWATDTMHSAAPAFSGTAFSAEDASKHWQVTLPANYVSERETVQRAQLIKAGARLAQLLQAIWP